MCTDILLGFIFKEPVHECYIEVVFVGSLFASLLISGLWRLNRIDPRQKLVVHHTLLTVWRSKSHRIRRIAFY